MVKTNLFNEYKLHILMYVPCIVYNLLFRPTNSQYINNNAYFVQIYDMT